MKKHTKTPYWIDDDKCIASGSDESYLTIAELIHKPEINGPFIVKACNSHEKNQKIKLAATKLVNEFERAIKTGDVFTKGLPAQMLLGDAVIFAKELQFALRAREV